MTLSWIIKLKSCVEVKSSYVSVASSADEILLKPKQIRKVLIDWFNSFEILTLRFNAQVILSVAWGYKRTPKTFEIKAKD